MKTNKTNKTETSKQATANNAEELKQVMEEANRKSLKASKSRKSSATKGFLEETHKELLANFLHSIKAVNGAEDKAEKIRLSLCLQYWEMGKQATELKQICKDENYRWMPFVKSLKIPQAKINRAMRLYAKYPDPAKLEKLGLREALKAVANNPKNPMLEQIKKEWNRIMSRKITDAAKKIVGREIGDDAKQALMKTLETAGVSLQDAFDTILAIAYSDGTLEETK